MSPSRRYASGQFLCALALLSAVPRLLIAEQPLPQGKTSSNEVAATPGHAALHATATVGEHPLHWVLQFARQEQAYLKGTVRDFTCRLVKRERIGGFLQDYQYIDMCAREEIRQGDQVVQPMSIFLHFLGPKNVAGRKVLYIDGQNDGRMMVRNGGKHFDYVIVNIDPNGDTAREESLVPITESGFNRVLSQMINVLERHVKADPSGENTKVERIPGAKINKRPVSIIRIVHAQHEDGLEFHVANVFLDDELRVPVRVDFSLWPSRPNQEPPLLAEYTYTDLQINVNLPDNTFSRAQLRAGR